jgi:biotin-(acetyl-CoA carboxylase) ligase
MVGRFDIAEFAAILEPDEPLASARRAFYAGMNALADTLSALAPPERSISIVWPDAIHVDGGLVGGGRLAWPTGASENAVPDWIVFGALIRTAGIAGDPVALVSAATLEDEGFTAGRDEHLIAKFSRHLMSSIDTWQSAGFELLVRSYQQRLETKKGATASIAPDGDLLLQWRGMAEPERQSLRHALRHPSWIDAIGREGRR